MSYLLPIQGTENSYLNPIIANKGIAASEDNADSSKEQSSVVLNLTGVLVEEETGLYSKADILSKKENLSGLTEEEEEQVGELEKRDKEVRQHEQTHAGMLGRYARGGPSYTYQTGPNGKIYAVGGSVKADVGTEATSAETIAKARILKAAATVSGDPSAADAGVAAKAAQMEATAAGKP